MLPLTRLDEFTFDKLNEESINLIHRIYPDWSDHNYHDPGITFIELFSWLAEMQQYYMNRITSESRLKFFKLLGIERRDIIPAQTEVSVNIKGNSFILPRGTKFNAGDITFETIDERLMISSNLEKAIVFSGAEVTDYSSSNNDRGVSFYAFGKSAKKGSRLYLGFDRDLPINEEIVLSIRLFDDRSKRNGELSIKNDDVNSRVSWRFHGSRYDKERDYDVYAWLPLKIKKDTTMNFTTSGELTFVITSEMKQRMIHPALDKNRYWICCDVQYEFEGLPPKIDSIGINRLNVIQQDTLSLVEYASATGDTLQKIELNHFLSIYGDVEVQVLNDDGSWSFWNEDFSEELTSSIKNNKEDNSIRRLYILSRDADRGKVYVIFGGKDGHAVPPKGIDNIRIISYSKDFEKRRLLGRSTGLPDQKFEIQESSIIPHSLMLQVIRRNSPAPGNTCYDYSLAEDFNISSSEDRHYVFYPDTGEIVFGNNEKGAIPEVSDDKNIIILALKRSIGKAGNVNSGMINTASELIPGLINADIFNNKEASGGEDRESLQNMLQRFSESLLEQQRAVTPEDFENLALLTPGNRVARVKALPLFSTELNNYPREQAEGVVSVVVVPYSEKLTPYPGHELLESVERHLDKYRLLTTDICAIAPEYIKITVGAVIVVRTKLKTNAEKIENELNLMLSPMQNSFSKGWEFGKSVIKSDIYELIYKNEDIEYIKELWIKGEGRGVQKNKNGDILIPPHGLVYYGKHEIEIVEIKDL